MKWKWKRPAAFLLAAAMIFTMSGVPASAVEADVSAASGNASAECICETHCEQGAVNPDCPVCAAEDADLSACLGKEAAVLSVQAMINDLPDELTEENAEDVSAKLGEIDAAMAALGDEERAALDLTQYQAAIAALAALAAAQEEIALYADDINKPRNGTGTTEDPYQIASTDEMEWFRDTVNAGNTKICAELMSDLNFSDKQSNGNWTWTPIGNSEVNAYTGTFDGNGYEIKKIRLVDVQAQSQTNRGLFGWIGTGGKVQDLAVSVQDVGNSSLSVSNSGLLSVNNAGMIERCSATISSALYTGSFGMIAYENRGKITDCLSYVGATGNKLSISDKAAGIARTNTGAISNCFFRGSFRTGKTDYAIAENKNGSITNCYYRDANNGRNGEVYIDGNKDTGDTVVWKDTSACASGEVAWLLNNSGSRDTWRMGSNKYPSLKKTDGRVNKNQDGSYNIGDKPHMHGDVEFTKVAALSDIKATGNYYIDAAVDVSSTWEVNGDVVLCLNGQTVTAKNEKAPAIKVSGNNRLKLLDCKEGKITGSGGTSILVDGGSLTLGGKAQITGNDKNILLAQGSKISFDSLDPSAKFGISVENQKDLSDPVAVTDATGGQYFGQLVADGFKDNGVGFELYLSDDGKTVMLGKQSAHTHCICGGRNTNLGHTSHSDVTFQPWRETDKLPTSGNYYLTRNVTLTKNATLQNANVCLNGYTVTLSDVGRIMSSGTTQLTDCSVGGKLESYSGKANGGVTISNGNTFCLYGGTFNGVKVEIGQTGGGTFNMYGGKITGNTQGTVVGQSKTSKNTTITINMYGGEISGNHISENQGGGVFVGSGNQFNMYGGTIQNNSAVDGGGVYVASAYNAYSAGTMTICGDAVIQGNNKASGVTNNVSLPSGKQITISGKLVKNANIGVTTRANLSQGNVNIATATDAGWVVAKNFTSDNSAYNVGLVNDGKTVQLQVHSHQWKYTANGATITAACKAPSCPAPAGGSVTINKPAHTTYGDGQSENATLTENNWQGLAVNQIAITYKKGNDILKTAPTDAGIYTANITLDEGENAKTASVEYTIEKATPSVGSWQGYPQAQSVFSGNAIQNPTSLTIYLDGKPSNLIPVDQLKFNWYNATKNGNDYVKNGDALGKNPTDAGDYIIEAVFAGDDNINAATSEWGLTISKAQVANNGVSIEVPLTVYPASGEYTYDVDIANALNNIPHGGGLEPNKTYGGSGISTNLNLVRSTRWDNGKLYVTMRPLANITGTTLGSITVNLTSKNYTVVPVVVKITLQPKQEVQDISVSMDNWTYGENAKTPQYPAMAGAEATVTYAAQGSSDFSTTVPTDAGNYTVKVQYEFGIMIHTGTANFTIAPKNISGVTINLGQQATYNGSGQDVAISSVMDGTYSLIAGGHDYAVVSGSKATNVGENTLVIKGKGNYTGTASKIWSLNAMEVTLDWGNITDRKWKDGKTVTATVSNKVGNDEVNVTVTGGDQTAVGGPYTATAAGLTGAQAGNYKLPADKEQTYSIGKADACKLLDITVSQKQSVTTEQSRDIGRAGMPADAGTLTYKLGASSVNGTATVNSFTIDENGMVKYTITGGVAGATVTLPVTIGSDNYADSTVNVVITLTDKDTPAVTANDITVTYDGNAIPDSKITGTATFNGNTVEGAWGFKTTAPKFVADSNDSVAVVFTPNDATTYAAVETNIKVTINKATPSGAPKYTEIKASGKRLADAGLTASLEDSNLFSTPGSIAWVDAENQTTPLAEDTPVEQGTAYRWLFMPTDTANYKTLSSTIVLWAKPASGGGGGGGVVTPAPTPSDADVITVKEDTKDNTTSKPGAETDTTITTKTTVKNTTTETTKNEQGQDVSKTTASVSKDLGDKLLDQAVSNKSDTIEITVKSNETNNNGSGAGASAADSVKATEVELPKATVNAIAKDTNADLVIKTDNGEVVLDNKTLETIAGAAKGDTVTIVVGENTQLKETQKPAEKIVGKNGTLFDLAAKIGEKLLHQFEGGKAHVTLPMPDKLKGKEVLVIYIDDNGLCKILNHSVEKIGAEDYIRFTTTHFSTFAVVDKDKAERPIKEQNAAHVKELMQSAKFKVTTTKTSKKSVKVQVAAKSSKTMISDIKSLGYTVKYQFYRSTKKTSGYKLLKTKAANTFTNTKGIKGTKYYYKARVLVYDGKTLVAKSALKQCGWGSQTWTK